MGKVPGGRVLWSRAKGGDRVRAALSFLTRIPVGRVRSGDYMRDLGRAAGFFPLVGLLVGAISLMAYLLGGLLFGPAVAGVAALAAGLWTTGAVHLDGLMDTADGVLSARSRERMLEIMRDSRVGVMGVAAGTLALLFRWALVLELTRGRVVAALLVAPALGRMVMPLAAVCWPPARAEGMGSSFGRHVGRAQVSGALLSGLMLSLVVPALAAWWMVGPDALADAVFRGLGAWLAVLGSCFAAGRWLCRRFGGLTGDTYGALCELAELAVLACFALNTGRGTGR
nr:MAG: adenosylcobinamide-GDP ribazoletransferase [Bacillota bacterium]